MTNSVFVSHAFKRDAKPLARKYHTLRTSIDRLIKDLENDPFLGENYGQGIYKVRLADESKGTGQRGGFRVMYYHLTVEEDHIDVLLLSIYSKSQISTIKKPQALKMLKQILNEYEKKSMGTK